MPYITCYILPHILLSHVFNYPSLGALLTRLKVSYYPILTLPHSYYPLSYITYIISPHVLYYPSQGALLTRLKVSWTSVENGSLAVDAVVTDEQVCVYGFMCGMFMYGLCVVCLGGWMDGRMDGFIFSV